MFMLHINGSLQIIFGLLLIEYDDTEIWRVRMCVEGGWVKMEIYKDIQRQKETHTENIL